MITYVSTCAYYVTAYEPWERFWAVTLKKSPQIILSTTTKTRLESYKKVGSDSAGGL